MIKFQTAEYPSILKEKPICPVFGQCGGCRYQDIPYPEELELKANSLHRLFGDHLGIGKDLFDPIVASPQPYHYRNRLDLKLLRTRQEGIFIGFSPENRFRVIAIDACPIAMKEVSDFIPQLKQEAMARLPEKYRIANLVVKTSQDKRVRWGGIGRHSLRMDEQDYLWTQVEGKKIFYSLDTFFQANLSILPMVIRKIKSFTEFWGPQTVLFDCYGGVGLFGICLAEEVKKVFLVEECAASVKLARFNANFHQFPNFEIHPAKVESVLPELMVSCPDSSKVIFIDPPRKGLSQTVINQLTQLHDARAIFYLSCSPESLVRDLKKFQQEMWDIEKVIPFDFFPRTKHIETLVLLRYRKN